jgi:hypothetical protein
MAQQGRSKRQAGCEVGFQTGSLQQANLHQGGRLMTQHVGCTGSAGQRANSHVCSLMLATCVHSALPASNFMQSWAMSTMICSCLLWDAPAIVLHSPVARSSGHAPAHPASCQHGAARWRPRGAGAPVAVGAARPAATHPLPAGCVYGSLHHAAGCLGMCQESWVNERGKLQELSVSGMYLMTCPMSCCCCCCHSMGAGCLPGRRNSRRPA